MNNEDNEARFKNFYAVNDNSPEISEKTDYSLTKNNKWFVLYTSNMQKNNVANKRQLISLKEEALMDSMDNFKRNYNVKNNIAIFNICKQIRNEQISTDQFNAPQKSFQKHVYDPNSNPNHKEVLFPFSRYKTSMKGLTKIESDKSLEKTIDDIFDQKMEYSIQAFRNYHNSYMDDTKEISEMNLNHFLIRPTLSINDNFNSKTNFKSSISNYKFEIEKVDTNLSKNLVKCIYPREPEPTPDPSLSSSKSKKITIKKKNKRIKETKKKCIEKVLIKRKKTKNEIKLKNKKKLEKIKRRERFAFLDLHKLKKNSEYYKEISKCFSFGLDQLLTHQKLIDDLLSQRKDHEIIADMQNLNKKKTFTSYLNKKKPGFDFKKEYEKHKKHEVESGQKKKQIRSYGVIRKYLHEKINIICSLDELEFLLSRVRGEKMLKIMINYKNTKILNIILHKRHN